MSTDTPRVSAPAGQAPIYRWRWQAFGVVLMASVMNLLDSLITNIAGPSIQQDIGGGAELLQWLGAGYTLAMAVGLITGGRLGDIFGRRTVFLVGAAGFTIASGLCAAAQNPEMLVGTRVLQGLFGALMLPQGLGVIKEVFPPRELTKAFGAYGPAMGLSTVAGPILGGWLVTADLFGLGWRMIFIINLPLGALLVTGALRFLPHNTPRTASTLDVGGAVMVALGAALLVYPVVQGRAAGWPWWTFASMAASLIVFTGFARYESVRQRRGLDPLIVTALFRKRSFTGSLVTAFFFYGAIVGFALVFTVFLQVGLGYTAFEAGLTALPQALGTVAGFIVGGSGLAAKLGRRLIQVGLGFMLVGLLSVFTVMQLAGTDVTGIMFAPCLLLNGIGLGFVLGPLYDIVLAGVDVKETGSASGTLNSLQQFAGAVGVAVLGTVFFGIVGGLVTAAADDAVPQLRERLAGAGVTGDRQDTLVTSLLACQRAAVATEDPTSTAPECTKLQSEVGAVAATSGPAVATEVAGTARTAMKEGFLRGAQRCVLVVLCIQLLTLATSFLMPRRARPSWDSGSWDAGKKDDAGKKHDDDRTISPDSPTAVAL